MGSIRTVAGEVAPGELGVTLTHEHLFIDTRKTMYAPSPDRSNSALTNQPISISNLNLVRLNSSACKDNLVIDDPDLVVRELQEFLRLGGRSVVDLTSKGLSPNPSGLAKVAERTGLNIVAGTGYYVASSHPPALRRRSVEEIAGEMIRAIEDGMGDSGVKAGVIGELGTSIRLASEEERVLRSAAMAHLETGCPISIHLSPPCGAAERVLDVIENAGADPAKVNLGHLDNNTNTKLHMKLAERGCYLSYDSFGLEYQEWYAPFFIPPGESKRATDSRPVVWPRDVERIAMVRELLQAGLGSRLLLSHDIGEKVDLQSYGGRGYSHILRTIVPWMMRNGIRRRDVNRMLVGNPADFLSFK